ncbi:helix-turn-helix transcriptional regulator [Rhodococcus pyridinivorans]|uniref:helix-turn-helix transcriptional regulator n=1 Tax=Rhodococcus pyridinivorans TaxID=103816 RepID=UPI00280C2B8C|nr:helix-turn-helix transcriptional regulator [Rhodococcus pyridinivorans]WMM74274.1 helix-turn-helix transcriptional regulator [Rhodococcus pyridinivorans]
MTTSLHNGWIIPEWTLSDRLRKAREVAGLTQSEIADRLELTRRTVGSYESGERAPKRTTIAAWAMATAVPVTWLETGTAPSPDGDGAAVVRHQGLEPRTR